MKAMLTAVRLSATSAALGGALVLAVVFPHAAGAAYAIAMHGAPALPKNFAALPYVNPDAPKGGRLVEGVLGTFDSLNPLIVMGVPVQAVRGFVIESLMARGDDEPFTLYGLLASSVETDDARDYVTFNLDPAAHFSDGVPVTPEDVVFSWKLLRDHGRPNHRAYYSKVVRAEILDAHKVRFDLSGDNRELPLILGLMPILPEHAIDVSTFEDTTLKKPIGSGPYLVADVDAGKSVTFKRDPNYWGRSLPINRGLWNFDEVRFDYYRDANSYFEAFKAGLYDVRNEEDPTRWRAGYDIPAVHDRRIIKESFPDGLPKLASDFVFNTRRPGFADIRVREAISSLFDFQWINRNFFYGLYRRSTSFFDDFGTVLLPSAGRCAGACASCILSRRRAPRRARRHLVAAGDRWLRSRPCAVAASARFIAICRLCARRYEIAQPRDGTSVEFRDHGDEQGRRAAGDRLF